MINHGAINTVLDAYSPILSLTVDKVSCIGRSVPIPAFEPSIIVDICEQTIETLRHKAEPHVQMPAPTYIIGDLHGNIFDFLRILIYASTPPTSRLLFLGDYVDRGSYSVEIVTLLFALYVAFPEYVVILRGNHEFEHVNQNYGFKDEVTSQYGDTVLWEKINSVFQWLPLTAVVGEDIFCVHGGLSPQITTLRALKRIKRPLENYEKDDIVCDLVWSDPSSDTPDYLRSNRGSGVTFGTNAIKDFCRTTKMKHIMRAHQCVPLGIERFNGDIVYTVFSCSNYVDYDGNRCGLVFITEDGGIKSFSLPAITQIPRNQAAFTELIVTSADRQSLAMNIKLLDLRSENKRSSTTMLSNTRRKSVILNVKMSGSSSTECLASASQRRSFLPRLQKISE